MDLFLVSGADIFAIYPRILKEILDAEELRRNQSGGIKDFIFLPSDVDFQEKVYYRLLAVQKTINDLVETGIPLSEIEAKKDKHVWDPEGLFFSISSSVSPSSDSAGRCSTSSSSTKQPKRKCVIDNPLTFLNLDMLYVWSLEDFCKAGKLLRKPPIQCQFNDEYEMRRVYSMIYDVFRYKHVLGQALHDVSFFTQYPQLLPDKNRIWLLLYDLHLRHFREREPQERIKQTFLYTESDLNNLHNQIFKHRINLAASISRLRIKNNALQLSQLLPIHLQDEKVALAAANPIVTGWINPFKMKTKDFAKQCLLSNGFIESNETATGESALEMNHYKWDKVCPLFLSCIPLDRGQFAQTTLIKKNQFIMQDRAFTLGPAVFSRLLHYFEIEGDVVQTHVSSPRSTAYLAALFFNNNRVHEFLAFGAGQRQQEYREFLSKLGCTNIRIYAENFCDIPIDSAIMDKVVGIFVSPPNSYSGVTDPIDLICSRGGDLSMLEVLTESEMSDDGKKRVSQILEQQRESLRLSMSRPQVQFCLYETHSVVDTENAAMVQRAIDYVNRCAHSKHIRIFKEKRRLELLAEMEGISAEQLEKLGGGMTAAKKKLKEKEDAAMAKRLNIHEIGGGDDDSLSNSSNESENETLETSRSRMSKRSNEPPNDEYNHIKIPKTDIFESVDVPDFCIYQDRCVTFKDHGCFLSLIKRKLVTRLDEKYLILMAERRGLFGDTSPKKGRYSRPVTKSSKKEIEKQKPVTKQKRRKSDDISELINRLIQPTHASARRSQRLRKSSADKRMILFDDTNCNRHSTKSCYGSSDQYTLRNSHHHHHNLNLSNHLTSTSIKQWWTETAKYVVKSLPKYHLVDDSLKSQFGSVKTKFGVGINIGSDDDNGNNDDDDDDTTDDGEDDDNDDGGGGGVNNIKKIIFTKTDRIFRAIKEKKIPPLKLPRPNKSKSNECIRYNNPNLHNNNRTLYPLVMNYLEFPNYPLPRYQPHFLYK